MGRRGGDEEERCWKYYQAEAAGRFGWAQRSEKGFAWSIWDVFKALKCNQRDTGRRRDFRASSLVEVWYW